MTLSSGFFDSVNSDRVYSAADFSRYIEGIITNGCIPNDTGFKVLNNPDPLDVGEPPSVIISAGKGYLDGMWARNDASFIYTIGTEQNNYDNYYHIIYLCFDTNVAARTVTVGHVSGDGAVVVIPADGAGKYYFPLAKVLDNKNLQATVDTDLRWLAGVSATGVATGSIVDGAVTHAKLADDAVQAHNINDASIETAHFNGAVVAEANLATNAVTETKIKDAEITGAKVKDDTLTFVKMLNEAETALAISATSGTNLQAGDSRYTNATGEYISKNGEVVAVTFYGELTCVTTGGKGAAFAQYTTDGGMTWTTIGTSNIFAMPLAQAYRVCTTVMLKTTATTHYRFRAGVTAYTKDANATSMGILTVYALM